MDSVSYALQRKAREQMKLILMQDILTDMTVSKIEGWPYLDYLQELKCLIDSFLPFGEGAKK